MHSAKANLLAWWLLFILSLFLWYRNLEADRVLAAWLFVLGLVQAIEYGVQSGADDEQAGRALFLALWLQCVVLAIGVYLLLPSRLALLFLVVFSLLFLLSLLYVLLSLDSFSASVGPGGQVEWRRGESTLLGPWSWLYLLGLLGPLLLLAFGLSSPAARTGVLLVLLYSLASAFLVWSLYPAEAFGSAWSYLAVGLGFLVFLSGALVPF